MEEGDLGALDILTPLLPMRKLTPENLQEQVAGTQARNQVLSVSSEAHTFLTEKGSANEGHRFSVSKALSLTSPQVAVSILHERPSSPLKLVIWGSGRMVSPTSFCPLIRQRLGPVDESCCPSPHLLVNFLLDLDPLWVRRALVVLGPLKLGGVRGLGGFESHVDKALIIHTNLDLPSI